MNKEDILAKLESLYQRAEKDYDVEKNSYYEGMVAAFDNAIAVVESFDQSADTNLDYKELYEQMCERCGYLDAELAKHADKSGQPIASAGPMEGQQPYPEIPTPDIISDGEHEDSYSRHVVETAMQSAHDRGYSVGWDHGLEHGRKESISFVAQKPVAWLHQCRKKPELRTLSFSASEPRLKPLGYASIPLYAAPVASAAQEPVAEVLSSRKGNDTSTIDKALPDGTKLYTDPAAAQPIDDTQFWTVSPKSSRRDLVLQIVQMNHRITVLREENQGLIRHLQGQREALRNYQKGNKSAEPVFTLDHVGSWYGDDNPAGCVLVGAWTGKSFPPQGAKFYLKEKSK